MGRGADIHYVIILRQFKFWKHFPSLNDAKIFPGVRLMLPTQTPSCFWNEPDLFANASFRSDSSQYATIFFQLLARFFLLQG